MATVHKYSSIKADLIGSYTLEVRSSRERRTDLLNNPKLLGVNTINSWTYKRSEKSVIGNKHPYQPPRVTFVINVCPIDQIYDDLLSIAFYSRGGL